MIELQSPTEERIDVRRFEDDLPARTLPGLRPARFKEIADAERGLYLDVRRAYRNMLEYLWPLLGLPGGLRFAAPQDPFELTAEIGAELDRAAQWFAKSLVGDVRDAEAFAQPSNAVIDQRLPIWEGEPILPGHLRTGFATGVERATVLTGADAAALLGVRNEGAQQDMLRRSFERLSEGARVKLADVLTAEGYAGSSIRDILITGMNEGKSPLVMGRELRARFKEIEDYNWPRLARTETAFAQNHAMRAEYEAEGYRLPKRESGAEIDEPPFHPNCLLPGVRVIAPDIVAGYHAWYNGQLVEITLAHGARLAVTVNHLLLTRNGFVAAQALSEGDDVIYSSQFEEIFAGDPDADQCPPLIEDVVNALTETSGVTTCRVPVTAEYLHGDGHFVEGNIDVIAADGFLMGNSIASVSKHLGSDVLNTDSTDLSGLPGSRDLSAMLGRLALAADGVMRGANHASPRFSGHLIGNKLLSFLLSTNADILGDQFSANSIPVDAEMIGDALGAFSGEVATSKVINVDRRFYSGHVYDLQTLSTAYIANGVVSSNCVCGTTISPETGHILVDVAATACEICQGHLVEQRTLVGDVEGEPMPAELIEE